MSSFIDRWISRVGESTNSGSNSRPRNTGNFVSYQTVSVKPTGDTPVYVNRKDNEIKTSPNNTNFPVHYFRQDSISVSDQNQNNKIEDMDALMNKGIGDSRKGSVASTASEESI
ncbi:hypothetical protein PACTADRAFT_47958 [Pachysolen tannophilus NRRL Y-2460]|uniref:Uncharacterized protein n=1 Tax=Pachysolen tannophilus NRRL Y-2460 TaxID=669874 RepID=A0A1E4U2E2_PACTA|nr:hypothetical protein PACTADRAFT_47958 [Pachysolen tannophilus NRRL Y-2460]